jgi:hypothetical protein
MSAGGSHDRAWRPIVAALLVVAATLAALLAIFAIWLNRQALNTDNWTKTSSQLLQEPVIRDRLAERLTDELFASVDVETALRDALPPRAQVLAAPAANALRTQVDKTARKALARPDIQALWSDANRSAHEQLLLVLDGGAGTVSTEQGRVVLDVSRLLATLQQQVGVGGRLRKVLPASASRLTLFESRQLSTAQQIVRALKPMPVVLVLLSLALAAAALAVARGRRRNVVRGYGFGFVVAGVGALLIRSVAGDSFVSALAQTAAAEPAIERVWSIATELLVEVAVAAVVYGLVMVAGAALAGPTRPATAVRRTVAPYLRQPLVAYAGLALALAGIVWWAPTPAWRNAAMLAILAALSAAGVETLRRQVIREFPEATPAAAALRRRERWDRLSAGTRRRGAALHESAAGTVRSAGAYAAARRPPTGSITLAEDRRIAQLERLAELHRSGVLDDGEFHTEKHRILHEEAAATERVAGP